MSLIDLAWLVAGATVPSFLVAWLAGYFVRGQAARWGLVDQPGDRKVHTHPTPLGGGLAIWLGVVVPLAVGHAMLDALAPAGQTPPAYLPRILAENLGGVFERARQVWILVGLGTILVALGLADDKRGLDWRLRISVETLVALAVVLGGWQFTFFVDLPWLTGAVTVVWIVGLINSFNMLDNMDGLSAGVAAIAGGLFALVMLLAPETPTGVPQLFVAGFLLILVGSACGFLVHNQPPAKLFMGDAGSYFVGYWLAVGTVLATFAHPGLPRHTILAPLCVLAVPIYDTTSVVLIRLRAGRSPFEGDRNHFSHRLAALGMTKPQAVLTIYLVTATTGLGALLLYQVTRPAGAGVILLLIGCVLAVIGILEHAARGKE